MAAPAEIPHADEALKTLVQRFKAAPGSSAFSELAGALLSRGHAGEALRITEHGLQLVPGSVEGRVQRAAALLAQSRPRMAYVELQRALAIEPNHRRARRLLGRAYVDAGAPERAARLLAQRSTGATDDAATRIAPASNLAAALVNDLTEEAPTTETVWPASSEQGSSNLPALFTALTKDLGLGSAVPEAPAPQRRVEVTQIIRRKALPRPPRSASELAEIDGPIVDTSLRGPLDHDEPAPTVTTRDTVPLFSTNPDLASLSFDDEPLFQEHMPFAVRPVGAMDDPVGGEPATALRAAERQPTAPLGPGGAKPYWSPPSETPRRGRQRPAGALPAAESARIDGLHGDRSAGVAHRLEVTSPPVRWGRVALAIIAAGLMATYFVGWLIYFEDALAIWWMD